METVQDRDRLEAEGPGRSRLLIIRRTGARLGSKDRPKQTERPRLDPADPRDRAKEEDSASLDLPSAAPARGPPRPPFAEQAPRRPYSFIASTLRLRHQTYRANGTTPQGDLLNAPMEALLAGVCDIVETEGPAHEEMISRLTAAWGTKRVPDSRGDSRCKGWQSIRSGSSGAVGSIGGSMGCAGRVPEHRHRHLRRPHCP